MVGKENFWTGIIDQPLANSAENVESIMQGQCEDVKAASRGLIEARFVKLAFTTKTTGSMWSTQEMKLQFGSPKPIKVEKTALKLSDVNDSYSPSDYAFDLFTTQYKFRILTMKLGAVYPIELVLDEDIFCQTRDLYPMELQFPSIKGQLLFKMTTSLKVAWKLSFLGMRK